MFPSAKTTLTPFHCFVAALAVVFASAATLRSADTSLLGTVRAADLSATTALLADGADPDGADDTGATPLMHAAAVGPLEIVRALVEAGAQVNASAADGSTALMWATGDVAKVRLLLDKGADIDARAKDGTTALVAATQRGAADVLRLLLERNADPMASGDEGALLFQAAFSTTNGDVRQVLSAAGLAPKHFGQVAPALGRIDAVDHDLITRYIGLGGDANLKVPMATVYTPLLAYVAMATGPQTVRLLLDRGADPNAVSTRGATALMMAAASERPNPETVRLLLSRGARPDARDEKGRSALDWALLQGETEVARLLRKHGAPASAAPAAAPAAAPGHPLRVRQSVEKAVATMDTIGPTFHQKTHCISCHNQSLPAMARQLAGTHGIAIDPAVASHAAKATIDTWAPRRNAQFTGRCGGGGYVPTTTYGLASLADEGAPGNSVTDSVAVCLASRQSPDGSWRVNDTRPPLSGNAIVFTALAIRGLTAYAPPALRWEMQRRVELGRSFLVAAEPRDTQDEAFALMGLVWSKASSAQIAARAARVLTLQRADGGWGQTALMAPDAYATGQALHALRLAGTPAGDSAYKSGVRYLLRTQQQDGTWFVQSRGFGFQPYAEYGFPHGRSQFLSAAATSWAVMGLAPAIR